MSDRRFAALVVLCLVAAAGVLFAGTRERKAAGEDTALRPVPGRPAAAAASAADVRAPSSARARAELRRLRSQTGLVDDGEIGPRLARLRGVGVVVNVWASWCPSCREEFPAFRRLSERYAGKVAFVGLASNDDRGEAARFLREFPVPYPSIFDADARQARSIGAGRGWPTTVFYDAAGRRRFVRQGGYAADRLLDADVRAYALAR